MATSRRTSISRSLRPAGRTSCAPRPSLRRPSRARRRRTRRPAFRRVHRCSSSSAAQLGREPGAMRSVLQHGLECVRRREHADCDGLLSSGAASVVSRSVEALVVHSGQRERAVPACPRSRGCAPSGTRAFAPAPTRPRSVVPASPRSRSLTASRPRSWRYAGDLEGRPTFVHRGAGDCAAPTPRAPRRRTSDRAGSETSDHRHRRIRRRSPRARSDFARRLVRALPRAGDSRGSPLPSRMSDAFATKVSTRFGSSTEPARARKPSTVRTTPPKPWRTTASAARCATRAAGTIASSRSP